MGDLDEKDKFEMKIYIHNKKTICKLNDNIKKQRELYLQDITIKKIKPIPIEKEYNIIKLQNELVNIESNVKKKIKKRMIQFFSLPKN